MLAEKLMCLELLATEMKESEILLRAELGFWETMKMVLSGDLNFLDVVGYQLGNMWDGFTGLLVDGIGGLLVMFGTGLEFLAVIGIIIGVFCIIFHYTKILRWSGLAYFMAVIIKCIGMLM